MRKIAGFVFLGVLASLSLARAEVDKKTERTWKSKCASCHGADGAAQTDQGKKLGIKDYTKADFHASVTDAQLKKAIVDGQGKEMPAYKDLGEQSDQLVQMIRSFKKSQAAGPVSRAPVPGRPGAAQAASGREPFRSPLFLPTPVGSPIARLSASAQLRAMATIHDKGLNEGQPGGAPIGSRQGGAPEKRDDTALNEVGRPHPTRNERERLARNPDLNQAGNSRGSQDQTQGSQTGNDVDTLPKP